MTYITDLVQTTFVRNDTKMTSGRSCRDSCAAVPNYLAAYFAKDLDCCIAGLRTAYVPAGALFLTTVSSTGSPFDPVDPDLRCGSYPVLIPTGVIMM